MLFKVQVLLKITHIADTACDGISEHGMHFAICLISLDDDNWWWRCWAGCGRSCQSNGSYCRDLIPGRVRKYGLESRILLNTL